MPLSDPAIDRRAYLLSLASGKEPAVLPPNPAGFGAQGAAQAPQAGPSMPGLGDALGPGNLATRGITDLASGDYAKGAGALAGGGLGGVAGLLIPGVGPIVGALLGGTLGNTFGGLFGAEDDKPTPPPFLPTRNMNPPLGRSF